MAIAGLSVKSGAKGKAASHSDYVARENGYERYLERGEVLEATGHGNMPNWAEHNQSEFWKASDAYERANGSAYREFQISLPRELNPDQRVALVEQFVAQEIGDRHAYQYAIHVPQASDGLTNPHVHLMFFAIQISISNAITQRSQRRAEHVKAMVLNLVQSLRELNEQMS